MSVQTHRHSVGRNRLNAKIKLIAIAAVMMMLLTGFVMVSAEGNDAAGSEQSKGLTVVYHPYKNTDVVTPGTNIKNYNDSTTFVMEYSGWAVSTEYNPQVWSPDNGTETAAKWNEITGYTVGTTLCFTGWSYGDGIYAPGDVITWKTSSWGDGWYTSDGFLLTAGNTLDVYATWDVLEGFQSYPGTGSVTNFGDSKYFTQGNPYTHIRLITSIYTYSWMISNNAIFNNCTVRGADNNSTINLGRNSITSDYTIIDNIKFLGYTTSEHGGNQGAITGKHLLILGDGIKSEKYDSSSKIHLDFPSLFSGNPAKVFEKSQLIVHSGIYNTVAGGSLNTSSSADSFTTVLKGGTVLDSVYGVYGGSNTLITGTVYLYLVGVTCPGDYYSMWAGDNSYRLEDDGHNELKLTESVAVCGGARWGTVTTSNVYVSGSTYLWDIQGAGRAGSDDTKVSNVNLDISGDAKIGHLVCGTQTDASSVSHPAAINVSIRVHDNAKVAMVLGAGYDTWQPVNPTVTNMVGGRISIAIDGGTVGDVFGGGYRGTTGTSTNKVTITINISGGNIGNVYGGGRGGYDKVLHSVNTSDTGTGSVYKESPGMADPTGYSYVYGDITINMDGGTAKNVYGGGESLPAFTRYGERNYNTVCENVATIYGSTTVNIKGNAEVSGAVYGGGRGVGFSAEELREYAMTHTVTPNGDFADIPWYNIDTSKLIFDIADLRYNDPTYNKIIYNTYSSSYVNYAKVIGNASVTVDGNASVGNVYGGGAFGAVGGSTKVYVGLGVHVAGDVYGAGKGISTDYRYGAVYSVETVDIYGRVAGNVYGGGAYGNVTSSSYLSVTIYRGAIIDGNVYGGGAGKSESYDADIGKVSGNVSVLVYGTVNESVYGGGAYGYVQGSSEITVYGATVMGDVFGGGVGKLGMSSVSENAKVIIRDGSDVKGSVYGGAKYGYVAASEVEFNSGTIGGALYGAGLGDNRNSTAYKSVTGNVILRISGGTVFGNVYGGSALGLVSGDVLVEISSGNVMGTVYAGGRGALNIVSVNGTRTLHLYGDAVVNESVYGGSSLGDDAAAGDKDALSSNAVIYVESGTIGGSVFGGGFQGHTYGSVDILIGKYSPYHSTVSGLTFENTGTVSKVSIGESVYLGGDVGEAVSSSDAFRYSLVKGGGTVLIDGTGYNGSTDTIAIELSGSVMGSGNSCLTDGVTKIRFLGFDNPDNMEGIHRATEVIIEKSSLVFNGRATVDETGSTLIMNSKFSLYKIDSLILRGGSNVSVNAAVENIGKYSSQNADGNETQKDSPSANKIVIGGGYTLSFRTVGANNSITYSLVSGYTIVGIRGDNSGFGGYVLGHNDSVGGFVLSNGGTFVVADFSKLSDTCKCWFVAGTVNNEITVTVVKGESGTESVVSMPSLQNGTIYRYTGGTFVTNAPNEKYEMDSGDSVEKNHFNVLFGFGTSDGFLTFGGPSGTYLEDYTTTRIDPVQGTVSGDTSNPGMHIKVYGVFSGSKYVGYTLVYINECREVQYQDDEGKTQTIYVVVNTIQTKINIYSSDISATTDSTEITLGTVNGTGTGELLIPAGSAGYEVAVTQVTSDSGSTVTKLYVQSSKNTDNTLGWTDRLGELPFYVNGVVTEGTVGTLQGGYMSTLLFTVRDFGGTSKEAYHVTLEMTRDGMVTKYLYVTIHVEPVADINVTFNGIKTGYTDSNATVSLTYSFRYGAILSESDCPPAGSNFVGWYTDENYNNPFSYSTPLTRDLELYALYMYKITFDYMDGTYSTLYVSMKSGKIIMDPPTRDGYDFIGWYTSTDFSKRWDLKNNIVTSDMTLYAYWLGKNVTVNFSYHAESGFVRLDGVSGSVVFGDRFDVKDKDTGEYLLDIAQKALEEKLKSEGKNVKFIYWVYEKYYGSAKDKAYAIYTSSFLDDFGKLDVSGDEYSVTLTAYLSDIAIKVVMDSTVYDDDGNSLDINANVDPPSEFLIFPTHTSEGSVYENKGTAHVSGLIGGNKVSVTDAIRLTVSGFSSEPNVYIRGTIDVTYLDGTPGTVPIDRINVKNDGLYRIVLPDYVVNVVSVSASLQDDKGNPVTGRGTVSWDPANNVYGDVTASLLLSGYVIDASGARVQITSDKVPIAVIDESGNAGFDLSGLHVSIKDVSGIIYLVVAESYPGMIIESASVENINIPQRGEEPVYDFVVQLNGATRPGYELTGWTLNADSSLFIRGKDYLFLAGGNINVCIAKSEVPGFSHTAIFSVLINGVFTDVVELGLTEEDMKKIKGETDPESGKIIPYEFKFMSHWEHIVYTVTIAELENGVIYAMYYDEATGQYVRFTEKNLYYGDSFKLVFYANDGYRFSGWKTSGEGVFDMLDSDSTTYVVKGDATISAYVVGPQIVTLYVTYDSVSNLTFIENVPDLVLSADGKVADFRFTKKAGILNGDGTYTVEYTGMANLGNHRVYLIGPDTGRLYDMGFAVKATTSENVYAIDAVTPVSSDNYDHVYHGKVIIVKNDITGATGGILYYTEYLFQYEGYNEDLTVKPVLWTTDVLIQLDGGFYEYHATDGSQQVDIHGESILSAENPSKAFTYRQGIVSRLTLDGEIVQQTHRVTVNYIRDTEIIGTGEVGYLGYGDRYWNLIGDITEYEKDGRTYAVNYWYYLKDGAETVYVNNGSVCDVSGVGDIVLYANVTVKSENYVKIVLQQQNANDDGYMTLDVDLKAYVISGERIRFQVPYYYGFRYAGAEAGPGVTDVNLDTETGILTAIRDRSGGEITVRYVRLTAAITIEDERGTFEETYRYGQSIDLFKPESTQLISYGNWVISNLHGSVSDNVYVVTLDDVTNYSESSAYRIGVSSAPRIYEVTVLTVNGKVTHTVNGASEYITVGKYFVIANQIIIGSKTDTAYTIVFTDSDGTVHTFTADRIMGYECNGWDKVEAGDELAVLDDLTVVAKWVPKTYNVNIYYDGAEGVNHVNAISATVAFNPATVRTDAAEAPYDKHSYITDIAYGAWVTIALTFDDKYTLDTDKLRSDVSFVKGNTLQQYTVTFLLNDTVLELVDGEYVVNIYLTSKYSGATIYFFMDGEPLTDDDGEVISIIGNAGTELLIEKDKIDRYVHVANGYYFDGWYDMDNNALFVKKVDGVWYYVIPSVPNMNLTLNAYSQKVTVSGIDDIYDGKEHSTAVEVIKGDRADVSYTTVFVRTDDESVKFENEMVTVTELRDPNNGKTFRYTVTVTKTQYLSEGVKADDFPGSVTVFEGTVDINLRPATVLIIAQNQFVAKSDITEDYRPDLKYTVIGLSEAELGGLHVTWNEVYLKDYGIYTISFTYTVDKSLEKFDIKTFDGTITVNKTGYSSVTV